MQVVVYMMDLQKNMSIDGRQENVDMIYFWDLKLHMKRLNFQEKCCIIYALVIVLNHQNVDHGMRKTHSEQMLGDQIWVSFCFWKGKQWIL